ncbi:MAG: glycogen-binding domain-containing protein [Pseudomonadota bacterium]
MPNKFSNKAPDINYLTGIIAGLPDEEPPDGFTQTVMQQISPKQANIWQKFWRLLITPFTVISIRPLHTAGTIILIVGLLFAYKTIWISHIYYPLTANSKTANIKTVNFILDYPSATTVAIIGSFNHWQPEHYHMQKNPTDGTWQLSVKMQPGRHTYAFVVDDNKIIADPRALWEQDDGFGTRNSILTISNGYSDENQT